jgi:hypothetical protein
MSGTYSTSFQMIRIAKESSAGGRMKYNPSMPYRKSTGQEKSAYKPT